MMTPEVFSEAELDRLRNQLREMDVWEAEDLVQIFLMAHGYGVRREALRGALSRVALNQCSMESMQSELQNLALVM